MRKKGKATAHVAIYREEHVASTPQGDVVEMSFIDLFPKKQSYVELLSGKKEKALPPKLYRHPFVDGPASERTFESDSRSFLQGEPDEC